MLGADIARDDDYRDLLETLRDDPYVVGAVLVGPRAVSELVTATSDYDLYIVLREADGRYPFVHGQPIEMISQTLDEFRRHGLPGSGSEWNRPTFLNARVEIDAADGEIRRLVDAKAHLAPEEARLLATAALDDYVNVLYRSLKNTEAGRAIAGSLDAAGSIPPLLTFLFAIDGRVRPFNKWLVREVERRPLALPDISERADTLIKDPSTSSQRAMFREIEPLARARGFGDVIDSWEPDVGWLRGR
jgi:hypothetical protein